MGSCSGPNMFLSEQTDALFEKISLNLFLHVLGPYDEIKIVPCAQKLFHAYIKN